MLSSSLLSEEGTETVVNRKKGRRRVGLIDAKQVKTICPLGEISRKLGLRSYSRHFEVEEDCGIVIYPEYKDVHVNYIILQTRFSI